MEAILQLRLPQVALACVKWTAEIPQEKENLGLF